MARERTIATLQALIENHTEMLREVRQQQRVYIARDFGLSPADVFIGTHPCAESPTRTHVYHTNTRKRFLAPCLYCLKEAA